MWKEDQEFKKSRFSFYQQNILNLPQDLRQMISLKAQAIGEAKQEHTKQFLVYCNNFGVTIQGWVSFDNLIMATPIMSIQVGNLALQPIENWMNHEC